MLKYSVNDIDIKIADMNVSLLQGLKDGFSYDYDYIELTKDEAITLANNIKEFYHGS